MPVEILMLRINDDALRISLGPCRAPARLVTPRSVGIPINAISRPSRDSAIGVRMKVAIPVNRGRNMGACPSLSALLVGSPGPGFVIRTPAFTDRPQRTRRIAASFHEPSEDSTSSSANRGNSSASLAPNYAVTQLRRAESAVSPADLARAALRAPLLNDDGKAPGPAIGFHRVVAVK
jgi:hypothetical protein